MKKIMILVVLALCALGFTGCRSALVTVEVVPADAKIIANGVLYEHGNPYVVECKRNKQLMITAFKEGYYNERHVIDYSLSTLGVVEACTSIFVLPLIGLAFDNAWKLDENNVSIELKPMDLEKK